MVKGNWEVGFVFVSLLISPFSPSTGRQTESFITPPRAIIDLILSYSKCDMLSAHHPTCICNVTYGEINLYLICHCSSSNDKKFFLEIQMNTQKRCAAISAFVRMQEGDELKLQGSSCPQERISKVAGGASGWCVKTTKLGLPKGICHSSRQISSEGMSQIRTHRWMHTWRCVLLLLLFTWMLQTHWFLILWYRHLS